VLDPKFADFVCVYLQTFSLPLEEDKKDVHLVIWFYLWSKDFCITSNLMVIIVVEFLFIYLALLGYVLVVYDWLSTVWPSVLVKTKGLVASIFSDKKCFLIKNI